MAQIELDSWMCLSHQRMKHFLRLTNINVGTSVANVKMPAYFLYYEACGVLAV